MWQWTTIMVVVNHRRMGAWWHPSLDLLLPLLLMMMMMGEGDAPIWIVHHNDKWEIIVVPVPWSIVVGLDVSADWYYWPDERLLPHPNHWIHRIITEINKFRRRQRQSMRYTITFRSLHDSHHHNIDGNVDYYQSKFVSRLPK